MRIAIAVAALLTTTIPGTAQSFSCRLGQPACLGYGDKVCNSNAKCVTQDAICFDSFTCNYDGFVCKSDMKKVVSAYDEVIIKHNALVDTLNDLRHCLRMADTVDEAQDCARRF